MKQRVFTQPGSFAPRRSNRVDPATGGSSYEQASSARSHPDCKGRVKSTLASYFDTATAISFRRKNGIVQGGLYKKAIGVPSGAQGEPLSTCSNSAVRSNTAASSVEPENRRTAKVLDGMSTNLTRLSVGCGSSDREYCAGMKNRMVRDFSDRLTSTGAVIAILSLAVSTSTGDVMAILFSPLFAPNM
jgi:hypothetical protein